MFQNRRQASLGNINLGNLSAAPSHQDMGFLIEQATRFKGRFVEVCWAMPKTGATFQLTAKIAMNQPLPVWMLYRTVNGSSELIWGHNSSDLTLMHNLVLLECEKPVEGGSNKISAGALDNMINSNRDAGAMARTNSESQTNMPSRASMAADYAAQQQSAPPNPAPAAMPPAATPAATPAAAVGNPSAAWLQNLSYGNTPAAKPADGGVAVQQASVSVAETEPPMIEQLTELSLEGNLSNIAVPNLYQYVVNNTLTGRLALQSTAGVGEVFFKNGVFKHAATLETKGEIALLDMATWEDGEFNFHPEDQTLQETIAVEPKVLLTHCKRLAESNRALKKAGIGPNTFLVQYHEGLPRAQFEQLMTQVGSRDIDQAWRAYKAIDGSGGVVDLLRRCPMVRVELINVMHSLLQSKVIQVSEHPQSNKRNCLEPLSINQSAIDQFVNFATDMRDGFLNEGAFLYLLQQEYHRYERTGARFSLAVFAIAKSNMLNGNIVPLDQPALTEAARRINGAKRKLDVAGHFDGDYALLLPETDTAGAAVFANRIGHLLRKTPLSPELEGSHEQLIMCFGIAGLPDDVNDLGTLLSAVRVSKNKAKMMGSPLVLYGQSM